MSGYRHGESAGTRRLPEWLRRPLAGGGAGAEVVDVLDTLQLNTVCRSAKCPNRGECYSRGTATFLVMGDACTRGCRFCAVDTRKPALLDADEPRRVAEAAQRLELSHVVITSVTRDDLPDGGAAHMAAVVEAVREAVPAATIEVLTSDFAGDLTDVDTVLAAEPDVFNHNVETVPALYATVRPGARYERSLAVLAHAAAKRPDTPVKSGIMVGLGETEEQVLAVMDDLLAAGVSILTIGQYLRPSQDHLPVVEFVEPGRFTAYARAGYKKGFRVVSSAPFVRSSYHAEEALS